MKVTYQLTSAELKIAIERWMDSNNTPVVDADTFTMEADGSVTIVVSAFPVPGSKPDVIAVTPAGVVPVPPIAPVPVASANFEKAFEWVIKWEGSSYENNAGDPGGPTKYGIDTRDDASDMPMGVSLRDLTLEQARAIYLKKYWLGSLCDKLPSPVAEVHFNYSVNTGNGTSVKFMQEALGIPVDGQFGPQTSLALGNADPKKTALSMIDHSDAYYHGRAESRPENFAQDLRGWLNRNADLRLFIASLS